MKISLIVLFIIIFNHLFLYASTDHELYDENYIEPYEFYNIDLELISEVSEYIKTLKNVKQLELSSKNKKTNLNTYRVLIFTKEGLLLENKKTYSFENRIEDLTIYYKYNTNDKVTEYYDNKYLITAEYGNNGQMIIKEDSFNDSSFQYSYDNGFLSNISSNSYVSNYTYKNKLPVYKNTYKIKDPSQIRTESYLYWDESTNIKTTSILSNFDGVETKIEKEYDRYGNLLLYKLNIDGKLYKKEHWIYDKKNRKVEYLSSNAPDAFFNYPVKQQWNYDDEDRIVEYREYDYDNTENIFYLNIHNRFEFIDEDNKKTIKKYNGQYLTSIVEMYFINNTLIEIQNIDYFNNSIISKKTTKIVYKKSEIEISKFDSQDTILEQTIIDLKYF